MNKYDITMLETAYLWGRLSYCKRRKVGAVIAKDGRILSTGYNGTVNSYKLNICEEIEPASFEEIEDPNIKTDICPECNGSSISKSDKNSNYIPCSSCSGVGYIKYLNKTNDFTVHAEQNAITFCTKNGIATEGTTLYITTSPCKMCAKLIVQSGIKRVVYSSEYRDKEGINFLKNVGIKVDFIKLK